MPGNVVLNPSVKSGWVYLHIQICWEEERFNVIHLLRQADTPHTHNQTVYIDDPRNHKATWSNHLD